MPGAISHDREDESIDAKARWFGSLTMEERIEVLCEWTDLAFALNPNIADSKDAQPIEGRVRVLELGKR